MSAEVELGRPGWFALLLDEAMARPADPEWAPPPGRVGPAVDVWVRERLWATGAGVGRAPDGRPGPVLAGTDPESAFVQLIRFELACARALLHASPPVSEPRLLLAGIVAASAGSLPVAEALDRAARGADACSAEETARLVSVTGSSLLRRAYLEGNPPDGLPLHHGLAGLEARFFARLTAAHLVRPEGLRARARRFLVQGSRARAGLVELVSAVVQANAPLSEEQKRRSRIQIRALLLSPDDRRRAIAALENPPPASQLIRALPTHLRESAVEQLALVSALAMPGSERLRRRIVDAAREAGVSEAQAAHVGDRTAAFIGRHEPWASALEQAARPSPLREMSDALSQAAAALALEVRETGELGLLLARAARGEKLDANERGRVRAQLVDLAKAVPALAIFAAPGGMLLLPLLLKLLPFDLRPSAFQKPVAKDPAA